MGVMPRPDSISAPQCLSCLKLLSERTAAISLSGLSRPNMCKSCFDALPISKRVQLQLICRPLNRGGLGIWDLLVKLNDLADGPQDF